MRTSARNHFSGKVAEVRHGAVNDEILLRSDAGLDIVAIITHGSAAALGLAAGTPAFALVKASSIIVMVGAADAVSARNRLPGTIARLTPGAVNAEVVIAVEGGAEVVAIVTNDSAIRLGLAEGGPATAIFKASSVIIGVDH